MKKVFLFLMGAFLLSSCKTIYPGEVGVKRRVGKLDNKIYGQGPVFYNFFTTRVLVVPVQTQNLEVKLELPSKEGLNILSTISILYHIDESKVPLVIRNIGMDYEQNVILSVFRSAAADVSSRFFAKDMHTGQRAVIEKEIATTMRELLEPRGFEIEAVLMKSIQLPPGLYKAVEDKLTAEQEAQRMEFIIAREKQEALRKRIEAEGNRDVQIILKEGINEMVLKFKALEAFEELAKSNNAKVIITDGKSPLILDVDKQAK